MASIKTPTIKIFLKKDYKSKKGYPLYLRFTLDRKPSPIPLNKYVPVEFWDEDSSQVKPGFHNYQKLNMFLTQKLQKADSIILNYELQNKQITFELFEAEFTEKSSHQDFFHFAEMEILSIANENYRKGTRAYVKKIKEFRPDLKLNQINYEFLIMYERWLKETKGNSIDTVATNLKFLRKLINEAMRRKLIYEYAFKDFTIKQGRQGGRQYLTIDEFKKVEQLLRFNLPHYLKNVLVHFLFGCLTGFRISDIQSFDGSCIEGNNLRIVMKKGRKELYLPLNNKIKNLIAFSSTINLHSISESKLRDYTKEILTLAGITKKITPHSWRHTFATIGASLGVSKEAMQELLGHDNLKTTSIYYRVENAVLREAMKKYDSI